MIYYKKLLHFHRGLQRMGLTVRKKMREDYLALLFTLSAVSHVLYSFSECIFLNTFSLCSNVSAIYHAHVSSTSDTWSYVLLLIQQRIIQHINTFINIVGPLRFIYNTLTETLSRFCNTECDVILLTTCAASSQRASPHVTV